MFKVACRNCNTALEVKGILEGSSFVCTRCLEVLESLGEDGRFLDVRTTLKDVFRLEAFKKKQDEVIQEVMAGHDAIFIQATGGGKSLCYQVPAMVMPGAALVILPLISLIRDQEMKLKALNIKTVALHGQAESSVMHLLQVIENDVSAHGGIKIILSTPETLFKNIQAEAVFRELYKKRLLNMVAIDELHCMVDWSQDFRPSYAECRRLRSDWGFTSIPFLGLTASIGGDDVQEATRTLGLLHPVIKVGQLNRRNIYYEIRKKPTKAPAIHNAIAETVTSMGAKSGLIYCSMKYECERLAMELSKLLERDVPYYHAECSQQAKENAMNAFMDGEIKTLVATSAFGMGIDKGDYVIHHSLPLSLTQLYQESGRAGRDGRNALSVVFYRFEDLAKQIQVIDPQYSVSKKVHRSASVPANAAVLRRIDLARQCALVLAGGRTGRECIRVSVLRALGVDVRVARLPQDEKCCSICATIVRKGQTIAEEKDMKEILEGVRDLLCNGKGNYTIMQLSGLLRGVRWKQHHSETETELRYKGVFQQFKQEVLLRSLEMLLHEGYFWLEETPVGLHWTACYLRNSFRSLPDQTTIVSFPWKIVLKRVKNRSSHPRKPSVKRRCASSSSDEADEINGSNASDAISASQDSEEKSISELLSHTSSEVEKSTSQSSDRTSPGSTSDSSIDALSRNTLPSGSAEESSSGTNISPRSTHNTSPSGNAEQSSSGTDTSSRSTELSESSPHVTSSKQEEGFACARDDDQSSYSEDDCDAGNIANASRDASDALCTPASQNPLCSENGDTQDGSDVFSFSASVAKELQHVAETSSMAASDTSARYKQLADTSEHDASYVHAGGFTSFFDVESEPRASSSVSSLTLQNDLQHKDELDNMLQCDQFEPPVAEDKQGCTVPAQIITCSLCHRTAIGNLPVPPQQQVITQQELHLQRRLQMLELRVTQIEGHSDRRAIAPPTLPILKLVQQGTITRDDSERRLPAERHSDALQSTLRSVVDETGEVLRATIRTAVQIRDAQRRSGPLDF